MLGAAELPLEVWRDCRTAADACALGVDSRWLGRVEPGGGELFLARFTECPAVVEARVSPST